MIQFFLTRFSISRALFCFLSLLVCSRSLLGDDSSKTFLRAYQSCQEGELLERNGHTQDALKKYWIAENLLEEIVKTDPSWQQAALEYRLKETRNGIRRLQPSVTFSGTPVTSSSDRRLADPCLQIINTSLQESDAGSKKLFVSIKSKTNTSFDIAQEKTQVFFYEQVGNKFVRSKAQITSKWISFESNKPQLLELTYWPELKNPVVGYVVAIYFKGDLQDSRSEPSFLKEHFPPNYFIGCD